MLCVHGVARMHTNQEGNRSWEWVSVESALECRAQSVSSAFFLAFMCLVHVC